MLGASQRRPRPLRILHIQIVGYNFKIYNYRNIIMSELFNISIKLEHDDYKRDLGIWEKEGDYIRDVSSNSFEYKMNSTDDICQGIIASQRYLCLNEKLFFRKYELFAEKIDITRGVYYSRIFRPIYSGSTTELEILRISDYKNRTKYENQILNHQCNIEFFHKSPIDRSHLFRSLEQLSSLVEMMKKIFRTVYPSTENEKAYGFDIRNLIILACTEFEDQIKGILEANNIPSISSYYTTKDYVRIKSILKLDQYVVTFRYYPDLQIIYPFGKWETETPTKSLFWYDSYNLIKHDRENHFKKGTLKVLVNSISACFIILLAQYGELKEIKEISSSFWTIYQKPDQLMRNTELYITPFKDQKWIKKQYEINSVH